MTLTWSWTLHVQVAGAVAHPKSLASFSNKSQEEAFLHLHDGVLVESKHLEKLFAGATLAVRKFCCWYVVLTPY